MLSSRVVFHLLLKVLKGFYKILLFKPYDYSTTFNNSRKNIKKPLFFKDKNAECLCNVVIQFLLNISISTVDCRWTG